MGAYFLHQCFEALSVGIGSNNASSFPGKASGNGISQSNGATGNDSNFF